MVTKQIRVAMSRQGNEGRIRGISLTMNHDTIHSLATTYQSFCLT